MKTANEVNVKCLRCPASGPVDDMCGCDDCGFFLCAECEAHLRCGCYEINMTLHPVTARVYYALLDTRYVSNAQSEALEDEIEELKALLDFDAAP
jgi:hypothetical protein